MSLSGCFNTDGNHLSLIGEGPSLSTLTIVQNQVVVSDTAHEMC